MPRSADNTTHEQGDARSASLVFLDALQVITRHRKFISRFVVACTIGSILLALLLPKWYKSTASVFPAEKADLFGGLEGIASFAKALTPSKALSALGSNPETDRYVAILKSGTVLGAVIQNSTWCTYTTSPRIPRRRPSRNF